MLLELARSRCDAPLEPSMAAGKQEKETLPVSHTGAARIQRTAGEAAFSLLIHHRDGVTVVPLLPRVPLTIGRGLPSDVVLSDGTLSRQHARFSLEEGTLQVRDLGSTNGTIVRGARVEQAELRPGDSVALGGVVVSPHMRSALEPQLANVPSHDNLCAAIDAELERARYFGDPLAVLFLEPQRINEAAHVSRWWRLLRAAFRPVDVPAVYSAHAIEVMLPRVTAEDAQLRARDLLKRAPSTTLLACGIAAFPGSGSTRDELLAAARAAAGRASAEQPIVRADSVRVDESRSDADAVAQSPGMREVFEMVDRLATVRLPILLLGETGVGKEVVARAIHRRGARSNGPLVCVNCGAISRALIESTLFGHEKGAFTGAVQSSRGVFGAAHGGTVLLDEIGELPAGAQTALLRVLEEGRMRPVGASDEVMIDVRVIAATHRDLESMCAQGSFREDLFFRLNAFTLSIPPLRERPEDIRLLCNRFIAEAGAQLSIAPDALAALERYSWPGNVRELRNAIERALVIATGTMIGIEDLPQRVCERHEAPPPAEDVLAGSGDLKERVRDFEARLIRAALDKTGGNQTEAARLLEVPVRTLSDKIRRLGIDARRS